MKILNLLATAVITTTGIAAITPQEAPQASLRPSR
jgi:hypothetical protein